MKLEGVLGSAARRVIRRVKRFGLRWGLPGARLVYDPRFAMPTTHVIDGRRAEKVIAHLTRVHVLDDKSVIRPAPLRARDVLAVHEPEYVTSLDRPEVLEPIFGGAMPPGTSPTAIMEAHRFACAGTVHAALTAIRYPWLKSPIFCLGGGFHHARSDKGSGYCALNDVAIAIGRLRAEGFTGRVLVVDLDYHQGDGTRSLFAKDESVHTFSVHAQTIDDSPAVAATDIELGPAIGDESYRAALIPALDAVFREVAPELVFYVAGADVAATDVLGNWRISSEGVAARDRAVFERAHGVPTVVTLSGGYGPEAWRYTTRTLVWLLAGDDQDIPTADERSLAGFRAIRQSISSVALRKDPATPSSKEDALLTDEDLFGDLTGRPVEKRFLGFYSVFGLEVAFERYGLSEHLRGRGYEGYVIDIESLAGALGDGLRVWADASRKDVLIELVMSELHTKPSAKLLSIEWLLLQDPRRTPADVPLLPGQKHPGLGCLRIVVGMLVMACERLGYDGLTLVPAHYHVAAIARRIFTFLEPADEAYFLALATATKHLTIAEASMTIGANGVAHRASHEPAPYRPSRMVLAVSEALKGHLADAAYAHAVEESAKDLDLVVA